MKNPILEQVKAAIRSPWAWPGGYPVYTIMADGELLCPKCARGNYREIAEATRDHDNRDWQAIGADILWEGEEYCCHCDATLESAYGFPDKGNDWLEA